MQIGQHRQLQIDLLLFLPIEMVKHRIFQMIENHRIELSLLLLDIDAQRPVEKTRRELEAAVPKFLEGPAGIDWRDGEKEIEGRYDIVDGPVCAPDRIDEGLAAERPVAGHLERVHPCRE